MRQQRSTTLGHVSRLLLEPAQPPADFWPVHTFRPSPKLRKYSLMIWFGKQLIALMGVLAAIVAEQWFEWSQWVNLIEETVISEGGSFGAFPEIIATLALVTGIIGYIIRASFTFAEAWLKLRTHWYMLGEEGLYIREGFLQVHELSIRFANIQQVTLKQNLLQRYFNIADVEVQTAGGSGKANNEGDGVNTDKRIGHLAVFRSVENPEELRNMLRGYVGKQSQPTPEHPEPATVDQTNTPAVLQAAQSLLNEAQALRKVYPHASLVD